MKKCTIIPAIAAVCFLAGCDWGSWCGKCSKQAEPTENVAKDIEPTSATEETKSTPVEATPEMPVETKTADEGK